MRLAENIRWQHFFHLLILRLYQMGKVHFFFPLNLKNRLLKPCKNETLVKGDELAKRILSLQNFSLPLVSRLMVELPQAKVAITFWDRWGHCIQPIFAAYITGNTDPQSLDLSNPQYCHLQVASNAKVAASRKPRTLLPSTSNSKWHHLLALQQIALGRTWGICLWKDQLVSWMFHTFWEWLGFGAGPVDVQS